MITNISIIIESMKHKLSLLILCAFLSFGFSIREKRPTVFVVGDSISMQYGPYLQNHLQGFFDYDRKRDNGLGTGNLDNPEGANGGDSRMVREYLELRLKDPGFKPDVLLINCGLHDIKRNSQTSAIQINETAYRQNLEAIYKLAKGRNIQLIWLRTTPVVDDRHNSRSKAFHRFSKDVDRYNAIADDVFSKRKVPMIDLYQFTLNLGDDTYIDHVHYKESARALQAAFIAGSLVTIVKGK
jgi:lysophospholipase L1-like esterase